VIQIYQTTNLTRAWPMSPANAATVARLKGQLLDLARIISCLERLSDDKERCSQDVRKLYARTVEALGHQAKALVLDTVMPDGISFSVEIEEEKC